jgi:glycerophosphoryl diester phosphodiesterase
MSTSTPVPIELLATCLWRTSDALIVKLDDVFGEPDDTYVNGSQVWLRENGPDAMMLEWRLHPVAGYAKPKGLPTIQVFSKTALAIAQGIAPIVPANRLWDGLEVFAAYDDEFTPDALRDAAISALGIEPDAFGMVDHERIGDAWEIADGQRSVVDDLLAQLQQ